MINAYKIVGLIKIMQIEIKDSMRIRPKIDVLGYGPSLDLGNEGILTPDQVIAFAAKMTYKDKTAKEMALEMLNSGEDIIKETGKSLRAVKRGHASISTSAALWVLVSGTSKFIDSGFTGAVYSSSLMPSGRRIPPTLENIVVPGGIMDASDETKAIYIDSSSENLIFYNDLITSKSPIKKEDAAKITQYGIAGSGFMLIPLETLLVYKKEFQNNVNWVPGECNDVVRIIEGKLISKGMSQLYENRSAAPRNTLAYPSIFKNPYKESIINYFERSYGIPNKPTIIVNKFYENTAFKKDMIKLNKLRKEITTDPETVKSHWRTLLDARYDIISRYNGILSFESFSNPSWRVWGEVKRHRTVGQNVESIYRAVERARKTFGRYEQRIRSGDLDDSLLKDVSRVVVIPDWFFKENELLKKYLFRFADSLDAYGKLTREVPESDAIAVVPRGIRLMVYKELDLHNIFEGYIPLRLCGTAENEMRTNTEEETGKMKEILPSYVARNIGPKCASVGFCMEEKPCGKIKEYIRYNYSTDVHRDIFNMI